MKTPPDVLYSSGVVEHAGSVRVIVHIKLAGRPVPGVARWLGPGQKWPLFPMKWHPVRLAYISDPPCLFSLATDGTIGFGYGSYAEEQPDLWGMEWFDGRLYVASDTALYRHIDAGLERVNVPGVATFGHLHANDGVLWSFGARDLAWTRDGKSWTRVPPMA